jgi:hypothetical protein
MSKEFLDGLEAEVYAAIRILEKERYSEHTWALAEMVRQAKHYQRIAETVLAGHVGLPSGPNEAEFKRANEARDWFRTEKIARPKPQRQCPELDK